MLEIRNLTKTYKGGKTAVADLSLTVHSGDIYGFIGHNGAGKTTTIRAKYWLTGKVSSPSPLPASRFWPTSPTIRISTNISPEFST